MSRQEDFIEAGIAYRMEHSKPMCIAGSNLADVERDFNRVLPFEAGCEYGYQYALTHPHWIPVEERLPEIPKNDWKSDNVLFVVNGEIFYGYRGKYTWFAPFVSFNNHEVTHWMEIVPPRKEE